MSIPIVCPTYSRFKTFVQSNEPRELLSETEYTELAKKINEKKKKERKKEDDADEDDDKEEEEEDDSEDTGVIAPEDKSKAQNKIIEKHVSLVSFVVISSLSSTSLTNS